VAKGFEQKTLKTMLQVISEELPDQPTVMISGPSHAEEVARMVPTALVAASTDPETARRVQDMTEAPMYACTPATMCWLCSWGVRLKTLYAFAMGIVEGLGLEDNTKAALMTLGLTELPA
jgi:glycerol-3-phosphate dehydrogenase (NAD(P)+)